MFGLGLELFWHGQRYPRQQVSAQLAPGWLTDLGRSRSGGKLSGGMPATRRLARAFATDAPILLMGRAVLRARFRLIRTNLQDELLELQRDG